MPGRTRIKLIPRIRIFLLAGLLLAGIGVFGQFYNGSQMTFGKNRIQYKEFLWTYFKFEDFDAYFYLNGRELAIATAKYATEQLPVMEQRLETSLSGKIQFIIFNNLSDLKQSNIGLIAGEHYNIGGITYILGNKVFIYFDGNQRNFEKQIRAGLANVLLNQIFYGPSIGSQIKNTTLLNVPEWYLNGLLSFLSEEWNSKIDSRVRDGILSGRFDKFNHLTGEDAIFAGHSLWRYVSDKYGAQAITDIVSMTRLSRNVESGFLYVVGVSFKNLVKDWREYFRTIYEEEEQRLETPEGQVLKRVKKDQVYGRFMISPGGNRSAYVINDEGRYKILLYDLDSRKKNVIHRGGFRLEEKIDYSYPLLAWHPGENILAYILERKGEVHLYFYNLQEKDYQRIILYNFEKVVDFSYSPDGASLLLSAVQKGQSDLFLFNIASGSHEQLTNDFYDDLEPVFFGQGGNILFTSNRPEEKFRWGDDDIPFSVPASTDLFLYSRADRGQSIRRVTATPHADEVQPIDLGDGRFAFLSDVNGIFNRYVGRYDSAISYIDTAVHYRYFTETYPVTNYSRGILEHSASQGSGKLAQVVFFDGRYRFQVVDKPPLVLAVRPDPEQTAFKIAGVVKAKEEAEQQRLKEMKRTTHRYTRKFKSVYRQERPDTVTVPGQEKTVDIRDYTFNRQAYLVLGGRDSLQNVGDTTVIGGDTGDSMQFTIPKRLNYRVEYSINELATQLDFTSLNYFYEPFTGAVNGFSNLGLNGFFLVGLTDLLEDHRIVGGFRIPSDLNNIDYIFSYSNLKRRLDKEIVVVRQATEEDFSAGFYTFIARYRSYQLYYILKYPFSPVLSARGTANVRYQKGSLLATNDVGLRAPDLDEYWAGLKGELVYDDTKELALNIYQGTRFKIFGEYTQTIEKSARDMTVVGFDVRHYQRIHRTFIWANRLAASTSFGRNRLIYFMGGVDNWLTPKFENDTPIDYSMDYAYQALSTNMRGFPQNIRNGNNFVVFNSELRFPVFRYFFNRPIRSDFINNFQLVGFGDIGTAWAGKDPYSEENSFYIRYIQDGSLWIKVREMKEPLVGGLGFGARTRLLGYFLRADIAWGIEDRTFLKPQFYLSLSLDF